MNMNMKLNTIYGNWTTRGYANSLIATSRTGQVADWTTRGLADDAKRTKTKHTKSPVASVSCPVCELSSTRVVQSASRPVRESSSPRVGVSASCPVFSN